MQVAVVIVYDGPRMLVNRRPDGSYYGGWWEWPGGKRHEGETFEECALRELREEIGIEVEGLREYDRRRAEYPGRSIELVFYVARLKPGSAPHADALEHRWLEAQEVKALRFLKPNLPVLERLSETPPVEAGCH